MLKKIILIHSLLFSLLSLVNSQTKVDAIATLSAITMHESPSFDSEIGTQALMGTPLRVLSEKDGWTNVMAPDGYTGWALNTGVCKMTPEAITIWKNAPKIIITSYFTILRERPSENSAVVCDLVMGNTLRLLKTTEKFYQVQLPDEKIGFIARKEAQPFEKWIQNNRPTAAHILSTARKFIGFPYTWGGTSVKGLDCSGFTKTCFFLNGVVLLRNASEQATTGEDVDLTNGIKLLQPADLLFFGKIIDGKPKVTHVALYIGNGEFIHSSGNVRVNSLLPESPIYDEYNTKRLLCARRILTQIDKDLKIFSIINHPFYK